MRDEAKAEDVTHATLHAVPANWTWARLGDVLADQPNALVDGPFGSKLKTEHYRDHGVRVLRLENIGDGEFVEKKSFIDEAHAKTLWRHSISPGDLAIASLGNVLPRVCIVPEGFGQGVVKADCIKCKPHPDVGPKFLLYWLQSSTLKAHVATMIRGVGRPRLNLSDIRRFPIPLAPRREREEIVSRIEELFSKIDAGERAISDARAALKRYRTSVLKAAVTGELTADWRAARGEPQESGETLLARILERRWAAWEHNELERLRAKGRPLPKSKAEWAKFHARYSEPVDVDDRGLPELPEGWLWANVDCLCPIDTANGISVAGSSEPPGIAALRLDAITEDGFDYSKRRYIQIAPEKASVMAVREGHLYVSRANGSKPLMGRAILAKAPPGLIVYPDTIIRFGIVGNFALWLKTIWPSRRVRDFLESRAKTSAGIWKIAQTDIKPMPVPVP